MGRNRRRYGGYVVHASVVLLAIGVAGSSAYDSVVEGRLARRRLAVGGRVHADLPRARRARRSERPNPRRPRRPREDDLGTLEAGKNAYSVERQVSNEVGIRSDLLTGEDLFVIAEQVNEDGTGSSSACS